jgi:hypothetical protein
LFPPALIHLLLCKWILIHLLQRHPIIFCYPGHRLPGRAGSNPTHISWARSTQINKWTKNK